MRGKTDICASKLLLLCFQQLKKHEYLVERSHITGPTQSKHLKGETIHSPSNQIRAGYTWETMTVSSLCSNMARACNQTQGDSQPKKSVNKPAFWEWIIRDRHITQLKNESISASAQKNFKTKSSQRVSWAKGSRIPIP